MPKKDVGCATYQLWKLLPYVRREKLPILTKKKETNIKYYYIDALPKYAITMQ